MLRFEKILGSAELLSPLLNFSKVTQVLEYRRDPLTGFWSRINVERSKRVKYSVRKEEIDEFIENSRRNCFFCPEHIENSTPKFSFSGGRIKVGEATVFPNLFPFGDHHAVVSLSTEHFLYPTQFQPKIIADGLRASLEFFREVLKRDPESQFCHLNWNFLPPAAASVVHPHFQVLADRKPTSYLALMLEKSREYARNGSNYWLDLLREEETRGERFIWGNDVLACLASFSPQANNEILLVLRRISSLLEMGEREVEEVALAVTKVVRRYGEMGIDSFNMTTFSGPPGAEYYRLNVKLVSRPNLRHLYIADAGFMERLHYESVVETLPEEVASKFRSAF